MRSRQTFVEKCYKDADGKVTLAQIPNLPIIVWLVMALLGWLVSSGTLHDVASVVGFGALFTWAWMELFSGANYLRRLLGLIVLLASIYSRVAK